MDRSGAIDKRAVSSRLTFERAAAALVLRHVCAASTRMRRIICAAMTKLRALVPFDLGHVYQAEVYLMHQCCGLESIGLAFILHMPARHEAQFGIYTLRQPRQRSLVAAVPGFQQTRDFSRGCADGQPGLPVAQKIYQNVAAFAVPFRLYQRKENKLSE